MRAEVMASKGILASDPSVAQMNATQWYFEYVAIKKKKQEAVTAAARLIRKMAVSILGLDAIRPVNSDGSVKTDDQMTPEEKESFLPLVAWVAHPEILEKVSNQLKEVTAIDSATSDEAYEKLVQAIDDAGGDMEPILGIDPQAGPVVYDSGPKVNNDKPLILDKSQIKVDL